MLVKTIFLADDDPDDLDLLTGALAEMLPNTQVQTFLNGEDLISHFSNKTAILPELIILDYSMPRIDGPALLKWLKTSKYNSIPAFIFSTSHVSTHRERCIDAGALDYFMKPSTTSELKFVLTEMLRRYEKII